ncbi:unnamed protein product, partial [Rotaria sp. Silwood2]
MSNNGKPIERVKERVNEHDISRGIIGSNSLGTCVFFLLSFQLKQKPQCFLYHHAFDFDESELSLTNLLEELLHKIWEKLRQCLNIRKTKRRHTTNFPINDVILVVGGGTVDEAIRIKMAFSLLNLGPKQEIIKLFMDPDVYHFYHHLLFRTIIIQSITKDTKPEEEDEAGTEEEKAMKAIDREPTSITDTKNPLSAESHDEIKDMSENDDEMMETNDTNEGETTAPITEYMVDYPSLELEYCCVTDVLNMDILWTSHSKKFYVATMKINLKPGLSSKYIWKKNEQEINEFLNIATFDEQGKFNEILILLSNNPLYCFPHIVWNIKIGINGFGRIGRLIFRCAIQQRIPHVLKTGPKPAVYRDFTGPVTGSHYIEFTA